MKITFHGAAQTVTGSKHLITLKNGTKILLDCGMFQGMGKDTNELNRNFGFKANEVSYVFLSHAHIDHSGLLPRLVKDGFKGKIFATPATIDIAKALLRDSAFIQEQDIYYMNKKRRLEGRPLLEPLYTEVDARNTFELFHPLNYNSPIKLPEGVELQLFDAGHIIGSASIFVTITEDGKEIKLMFSGDVGRYRDPILNSPECYPQADYIIIESTYGNKVHAPIEGYGAELKKQIQKTCIEKKGKLIIPAFSVGRTQELLFALNELELEGELPPVDYYVDSPLSTTITKIVKSHPECYNRALQNLLKRDNDPFDFKGLRYITDKRDSQALNKSIKPCVIISASGMAEAGRVKHHIANSIENWRNTILIVGYCEPNSLGGRLKKHPEEIGIFGDRFAVNADIQTIDSMSAHADFNDLSQFLACQDASEVKQIFVVHGEPKVQKEFRLRLMKKGFKDAVIPQAHQEFELKTKE
ncbi:MBL fold hydrolase [Bacteroidales bacterium]|nr:MBL fold hydrolase [Bacteroidales bacterium]